MADNSVLLDLFGDAPRRRDPGPQISRPNVFSGRPDETAYSSWLQKYGLREDSTYDTYAAFKAGLQPDERGHLVDTYKKPNHPTFSAESQFSGQDGKVGGQWVPAAGGKWVFKASPWNLQNMTREQLMDYFDRVEAGNTIQFPNGPSYLGGSRK